MRAPGGKIARDTKRGGKPLHRQFHGIKESSALEQDRIDFSEVDYRVQIFACGSIGISDREATLLIIAFFLWVVSGLAAIVNVALILTSRGRIALSGHALFFSFYGSLAWLFCRDALPVFSWPGVSMLCMYLIPFLVLLHFAVLVRQARRRWREPVNESGMSALEIAQAARSADQRAGKV